MSIRMFCFSQWVTFISIWWHLKDVKCNHFWQTTSEISSPAYRNKSQALQMVRMEMVISMLGICFRKKQHISDTEDFWPQNQLWAVSQQRWLEFRWTVRFGTLCNRGSTKSCHPCISDNRIGLIAVTLCAHICQPTFMACLEMFLIGKFSFGRMGFPISNVAILRVFFFLLNLAFHERNS